MPGVDIIALIINVLIVLIIIEAVISNIIAFGGKIPSRHPLVVGLRKIVNPLLRPIRRLLPPRRFGGLDLSPLIVILLLDALNYLVHSR